MFLSLKRLALVGAVAFATFGAQAQEVTWRVPTSVPEGSPFYVNFLERFADNVGLLTDGAVEIQPFGAGILVPALQVYDGVKDGIVEAGHSTPSYLVNQDPVNAIFAGFPGGMGPEAYSTWIFEEGGKEKLAEIRAEEGLKSLVVGIGSSEIMAHANKPIKSAADLKGLKYRTSGPWAEVMRDYFDAVPTVVPPGEIYTLLERKGVDAIEWGPPSGNLPEGFHEAAPYIVVPGVHQPTFLWEVVVKQETWDALDEALRGEDRSGRRADHASVSGPLLRSGHEGDGDASRQQGRGDRARCGLPERTVRCGPRLDQENRRSPEGRGQAPHGRNP